MAEYLDVDNWKRREIFEFFLNFDNPYFGLCTRVEVTRLLQVLRNGPKRSSTLAYHYFALRVANEIEPFRYRLRDGRVLVHPVIHGATTVLLANETFTFAYFDYDEDFARCMAGAEQAVAAIKLEGGFKNRDNDDNMIHCTVIPWVSFTSFSHARNWGRQDSVPKISFGKFVTEGGRTFLPVSVEVHHALMDGLHVGRFFQRFEEMLNDPERTVLSS
jgi:chloramphenicol O-acetyltransferase type A